jgi:adenylyltransferase/sulfurtransferase
VGVIASWQAMLALKHLVIRHREQELHLDSHAPKSRLTAFDLWTGDVRTMVLPRVEDCPCCMQRRFPFLDGEHASDAKPMCGKNSVQIQSPAGTEVDFERLARRLAGHGRLVQTPFLLRFQVDSWTISLFRDGRAVVQGTENPDEARKIYQRWIGG